MYLETLNKLRGAEKNGERYVAETIIGLELQRIKGIVNSLNIGKIF